MALLNKSVAAQEAWAQELVFLGNLFNKPAIFSNYAPVLMAHEIFKTQPNKSIWEKTAAHYIKYGVLPVDPTVRSQVFTEKEIEVLASGQDVASDESGKTQFLLDSFDETIKLTMLKQLRATMDLCMSEGINDVGKALDVIGKTLGDIGRVSTSKLGLGSISDLDVLTKWATGELSTQQPLVPIPLKGIEKYIAGVPRGEVNFMIAPYGKGKTTALCCLAAGMLDTSDVMYVTLEMPAPNILFKVLGSRSRGRVDSNMAFYKPDELDGEGQERVSKNAVDAIESYTNNPHRMYFLDVPARSIKATHIAMELQRLRVQGAKIDSVIVDYGDLLQSEQGGMADMGWQYMAAVAEELSALAKSEGVTVWSASQTGKGLGSDSDDLKKFRPLRGKDLWGSDGKMHTGCLALGMSIYRLPKHPRYGVGALSTLKNRYAIGGFFGDMLVKVDYATSSIEVVGSITDLEIESGVWADTLQSMVDQTEQMVMMQRGPQGKPAFQQRTDLVSLKRHSTPKILIQPEEEREF